MNKSRDHFGDLGRAIYLLAIALGILSYFTVKLLPYSAINLIALLLNLSAGLILTGLIFFLLRWLSFDLDERRQSNLQEATDRLDHAIQNINRLKILEESDLIRYCNRVTDTTPDKWYEYLRASNGPIWLMAPSLKAWFKNDEDEMTRILVDKASQGTEIRFMIMGAENDVGEQIAELATSGSPNIGFYDRAALQQNEFLMRQRLEEVNKQIKEKSSQTTPYYVQLKKVTGSPMFIKAEFFGDILHWSFFGYNLDGQMAPSFWCQERKLEAGQRRLYQIIKKEFLTIWGDDSISREIDIKPKDVPQTPPVAVN